MASASTTLDVAAGRGRGRRDDHGDPQRSRRVWMSTVFVLRSRTPPRTSRKETFLATPGLACRPLSMKVLIVSNLDSDRPFGQFLRPFHMGRGLARHGLDVGNVGVNCSRIDFGTDVVNRREVPGEGRPPGRQGAGGVRPRRDLRARATAGHGVSACPTRRAGGRRPALPSLRRVARLCGRGCGAPGHRLPPGGLSGLAQRAPDRPPCRSPDRRRSERGPTHERALSASGRLPWWSSTGSTARCFRRPRTRRAPTYSLEIVTP